MFWNKWSRSFKRAVGSSFYCPRKSFLGWLTLKYMESSNRYLEERAVDLCDLQPNQKILEIGFGPGVGLSYACKMIQSRGSGTGKVTGVDFSPYVVDRAFKKFDEQISKGSVEILFSDARLLPFFSGKFDYVIHTNCHYYWILPEASAAEIFRVLKPGGQVITTMDLAKLRRLQKKGWLSRASIDPLLYMVSIEAAGFTDVHIEYLKSNSNTYQAIFAKKPKEKISKDINAG